MKGILNENIIQLLNLRPEALDQAPEAVEKIVESIEDAKQPRTNPNPAAVTEMTLEGTDHAVAMDGLHDEMLQHARDLMAYGFNIDHPRARGIFEIAASLYGHAITSKNSKRDAQLRAMKLALDAKRVDLEEKRTNGAIGLTTDSEGTVLVEDRNELLRRIRQQMAERSSPDK